MGDAVAGRVCAIPAESGGDIGRTIDACARLVLYATPLTQPKALTRVWCLFEIMSAVKRDRLLPVGAFDDVPVAPVAGPAAHRAVLVRPPVSLRLCTPRCAPAAV